jgi:hypothetical protein
MRAHRVTSLLRDIGVFHCQAIKQMRLALTIKLYLILS